MYCDKTEVPAAAAAQAKLALLTMYGCLIFRPTVPLLRPAQHVSPAQKGVTVSTDIIVRGGAAQGNKSTSTPF